MTELAASGIPVTVTCRVLKLSRQPYYRWLADPIRPSEVVEAYRANALFDAHKDDPEFGLILTLSLRRTAKTETRRPLMFGLAISGHGRRITFERIRAEKCPKCGGSVRYYDKPTQWINHREANGRRWREVTERVPALECRRNQKHWFEVDPAETLAG
ncbi:hypothetical protein [Microbacterium sp. PAMC22086]|uniref:hypothetical protein n=1 Tax=Microbacterium sp. PAMC22086 TaxID=2861281 RepID=UPI000D8495F8|nr:hypothetical protein [Microbacterium sp. PAMC22086]QYG10462.1 hypothetical protein KY497_08920 [Microbacterium sp. PAMC22086]